MSIEQTLRDRSQSSCELCGRQDALHVMPIAPKDDSHSDHCILICSTCNDQLSGQQPLNVDHWRCLNDSMWSQIPAVQVQAWRQLSKLTQAGETWAQNLLDMLYLEDDIMAWAQSGFNLEGNTSEQEEKHRDCNGTELQAGDTVTLIKDLDVKGAGFTAKRGTAVRNIGLVADNPEHIEGRVNGTRIVLLTKYLKKS